MSRAQAQTLSVLRTLLRHARATSANCPVAIAAAASHATKMGAESTVSLSIPSASSASSSRGGRLAGGGWAAYIMSQYRSNASLSKRSEIKAARDSAKDLSEYLAAVSVQAALTEAYRGADVDSNDQRRNVARFVGFDMPQIPEGAQVGPLAERYTAAAVDKYAGTLASRLGGDAGLAAPSAGAGASAASGSGASAASGSGSGTRLTGLDAIKAQYYGVASLSPTLQAAQAQAQQAQAGGSGAAASARGGAVTPPPAMDPAAAAAAKAAAAAAYAERLKSKAAAKAAAASAAGGAFA